MISMKHSNKLNKNFKNRIEIPNRFKFNNKFLMKLFRKKKIKKLLINQNH